MYILNPETCTLAALSEYRRINVIGTSGSGKSTFAKALADIQQLPYYEMDQLFWKADWEESDDEEFLPRVAQVAALEDWVLDGNYSRTFSIKFKRAQLLIWIDLPFFTTTYRVTRRAISRSLSQKELWPGTGNMESLQRAFFSRKSVIWWSMTHHRSTRIKYRQLMRSDDYAHIAFLHLTSRAQISRLLTQ
ncbi:MAG: adenylate kinase [bacterium]